MTEAVHCGHVAVVDPHGAVVAAVGRPHEVIYPRSAVKPFQAAVTLDLAGTDVPSSEVAIMAASHTGGREHQACVRRVLDRAGLTARALRCPPALPDDAAALAQRPQPTRIAHNCSGKHAGFLWASVAADADPARYLSDATPVQKAVRERLADVCAVDPSGPGVDGCGAPAWRMPLSALAQGFAVLATATAERGPSAPGRHTPTTGDPAGDATRAGGTLGVVGVAMRTHPVLVGGHGAVDTRIMSAADAVVAKRGAEGVLGVAVTAPRPLGVAIKISDGGRRAVGPVAATVLGAIGVRLPPALARPPVLGGGVAHGAIEPARALCVTVERDLAR